MSNFDVVDEEQCIKSSRFPYVDYPFERFNRVQSTIIRNKLHKRNENLVLATKTATGKTISAELFMAPVLDDQQKKVLYVSPLKALTQEKTVEWGETFDDLKIQALTSDQKEPADKIERRLNAADIICMTSEMLDSRTRKYDEDKACWLDEVGLIILDESHIISSPNRGHAVEVGLMRFASHNDCPILFLSATMPNVQDFKAWLTTLNSRETNVINSEWRPHTLNWHYISHGSDSHAMLRAKKIEMCLDLVNNKPNEKFLIFVHDKRTGRDLEKALDNSGIETGFHNADLGPAERGRIERSFRQDDGMRVIVATSTLAWGVNIMSPNVIICGVHRGLQYVDELDLIQEAGRAGRAGEGNCYLLCDDKEKWKLNIETPRSVISCLMDKGTLGFHILAEIQNKEITNLEDLFIWFERSLAHQQGTMDNNVVHDTLADLQKMNMLKIEQGVFEITALGRISASLYYLPHDIYWWSKAFRQIDNAGAWNEDKAVCWALASAPSYGLNYVPEGEQKRVEEFTNDVRSILRNNKIPPSVVAADCYDVLQGHHKSHAMFSFAYDLERITQALTWMDGIYKWDKKDLFDSMVIAINSNVPRHLARLCSVPGIGIARAEKLYKNGFKTPKDLMDSSKRMRLTKVLGQKTVKGLIEKLEKVAA